MNRFTNKHKMPDNDKDKFNLACKLMAGQMVAQTGMPEELASQAAHEMVSHVMDETERYRERVARRWRALSAMHFN